MTYTIDKERSTVIKVTIATMLRNVGVSLRSLRREDILWARPSEESGVDCVSDQDVDRGVDSGHIISPSWCGGMKEHLLAMA